MGPCRRRRRRGTGPPDEAADERWRRKRGGVRSTTDRLELDEQPRLTLPCTLPATNIRSRIMSVSIRQELRPPFRQSRIACRVQGARWSCTTPTGSLRFSRASAQKSQRRCLVGLYSAACLLTHNTPSSLLISSHLTPHQTTGGDIQTRVRRADKTIRQEIRDHYLFELGDHQNMILPPGMRDEPGLRQQRDAGSTKRMLDESEEKQLQAALDLALPGSARSKMDLQKKYLWERIREVGLEPHIRALKIAPSRRSQEQIDV